MLWQTIADNFISIICAGVAGTATGVLVWAVKRLQGIFISEKVNCREKICRFGEFYILTNQITLEELDNLTDIYQVYHKYLNGNGTASNVYERCKKLPIVAERTIRNPYYTGVELFSDDKMPPKQ